MISISDKQNETILLTDCVGGIVNLKNLHNCTVNIACQIGALNMYACHDSAFSFVFVKGACNVFKSTNCRIETASQQLRITECCDLDISAATKAAPALVESSRVVFRKLLFREEHKMALGENFQSFVDSDVWRNIQDFNSLNGSLNNFKIV